MKEFPCLLILLLLSLSCKKPKLPPVSPAKQCSNSFMAFEDVGVDSLRLIGVDTATAQSRNSLYGFVRTRQGTGVYIPEEKVYYTFQQDNAGKMFLVRYHLQNNQTDILNYSGALNLLSNPYDFQILYSAKYAKLFYIHSHDESKIFELIIDGPTCTEKEIAPRSGMLGLITWAGINEATGEICFYFYGKGYQVYDPGTDKVVTSVPNNSIFCIEFNSNDNMFYGIDIYNNPARFCKMSPRTGEVVEIKSLAIDIEGYYKHGTFDVCKNQYILQVGGYDSYPASIYWIDVKTGNIVKEIHSNNQYTELTSTEKYN